MTDTTTLDTLLDQAWSRAYADTTESRDLALAVLDQAPAGSEAAAWAQWLLALAEVHSYNAPSARARLHPARETFIKLGDARGQAMCAELDAAMALQIGDPIRASLIHRALDGARGANYKAIDRFYAHQQRGCFARSLGQWDLALKHLDTAWETAELSGNAAAVALVRAQMGSLLLEYGRLDDAQTHCQAALALAQEVGARGVVTSTAASLIVIHDALGEYEASRAQAQFLLDHPHSQVPGSLARVAVPLALSYFRAGEADRAEAWLEAGSTVTPGDGDNAVFWAWLSARCLIQRGEARLAADLAERTLTAREGRSLPFHWALLLDTAAAAHEQLGHALQSLQHREAAKRLAAHFDAVPSGASRSGLATTAALLRDARHSVPA